MTIQEVYNTFDRFARDYPRTKRVDTDGVPKGAVYQCVDLVKKYLEYFGIQGGAYGNGVDYWYKTNAKILTKFDRIQTTNVVKGDIVPMRTLGRNDGQGNGHIGIATGYQTASQIELYEQNGSTGKGQGTGNDAIRTRMVEKSRVPGVLRPKTVAAPAPQPTATQSGMPRVGQVVHFDKGTTRTIFQPNGTSKQMYMADDTYDYVVRGISNNQIVINSAKFGNGIRVALFYLAGGRIDGWRIK